VNAEASDFSPSRTLGAVPADSKFRAFFNRGFVISQFMSRYLKENKLSLKQFKDSVLARPLPGLGYRQYPRLREEVQTVSGMISRPMMPPTAGEMTRFGELTVETTQAQTRLDGIIERRVVKINDLLKGTPHLLIQPPARTFVP
jgi:hypothetical protein